MPEELVYACGAMPVPGGLIRGGEHEPVLVAGVVGSCTSRVAVIARTVGFKKEVIFTGGVAKNIGVWKFLEKDIGMEIIIPESPQTMGALGAALLAKAELSKMA